MASFASERLQMKALKRTHPKDFQVQDFCVVFFPKETRYSVTNCKSLAEWSEGSDPLDLLSVVTVRKSGKKFKATLMFLGTEKECIIKTKELEKAFSLTSPSNKKRDDDDDDYNDDKDDYEEDDDEDDDNSESELPPVDKELNNELKKIEALSKTSKTKRANENKEMKKLNNDYDNDYCDNHGKPPNETQKLDPNWSLIHKKLDRILDLLEKRDNREVEVITPPPSKKVKRSMMVAEDEIAGQPSLADGGSPSLPTLMHEGVNLLSISSGGDVKKYSLKVFSKLFTKEEMVNGMIGPIERVKTKGKVILNERKVEIMKNAITLKFGEQTLLKKWSAARQCCNQKCLDTKKLFLKMEAKTHGEEPKLQSLSHEKEDDDQSL